MLGLTAEPHEMFCKRICKESRKRIQDVRVWACMAFEDNVDGLRRRRSA